MDEVDKAKKVLNKNPKCDLGAKFIRNGNLDFGSLEKVTLMGERDFVSVDQIHSSQSCANNNPVSFLLFCNVLLCQITVNKYGFSYFTKNRKEKKVTRLF